jgi:hypothetical protein
VSKSAVSKSDKPALADTRRAEREARAWRDLAATIEEAWRSKFGEPTVVAIAHIHEIRRRGD